MKSYTDLAQSKKLTEILPIESADYHYIAQGEKSYFYPYFLSSNAVKNYDEEIKYIPCWSLAALLDVLPNYQLQTQDDGTGLLCSCNGRFNIVTADNSIDACYEMILKLNGQKLL